MCRGVESQKAQKRIKKHRNNAKKDRTTGIDQHFREPNQSFKDIRMIIIQEVFDRNMTQEQVRQTLLRRDDFLIAKRNRFNDKLNIPHA